MNEVVIALVSLGFVGVIINGKNEQHDSGNTPSISTNLVEHDSGNTPSNFN